MTDEERREFDAMRERIEDLERRLAQYEPPHVKAHAEPAATIFDYDDEECP